MAYDQANYTQGSPFAPKQILADGEYTMRKVTILSGASLVAGSLIGPVMAAAAATATAGAHVSGTGATVGTGTFGTITVDAGAPDGTWNVRFTDPTHFEVIRPNATIDGVGVAGTAYNGGINFTYTAGGTADVEDDHIPIVVSYAGAFKYKLSASASSDGSQTPDLVLAQDADASGGDVEAMAYETGTFNEAALTLGTGITVAAVREGLRIKGILIDS